MCVNFYIYKLYRVKILIKFNIQGSLKLIKINFYSFFSLLTVLHLTYKTQNNNKNSNNHLVCQTLLNYTLLSIIYSTYTDIFKGSFRESRSMLLSRRLYFRSFSHTYYNSVKTNVHVYTIQLYNQKYI